jgi:hypothetical protein
MSKRTNVQSMINLLYFANNYPSGWIQSVWGNDMLSKHIENKWVAESERCNNNGTQGFIRLFMQLSQINQERLCQWIEDNYRGMS